MTSNDSRASRVPQRGWKSVLLCVCPVLLGGCAGAVGSNPGGGGGNPTPISISNPAAGSVTSTSAVISWTTNMPGDSQVEYGPTGTYGQSTALDSSLVTNHSFTLNGLNAGTLYHFRVKSHDSSGAMAASGDQTFTTSAVADTTPPTVSITAPAPGATLSGATNVTATAADNVGVASVQFKLDGANLGSAVTSSPYSVPWNTASASNGSHSLTAVARDAAGNTATSVGINVTVNNAQPDTTPPSVPPNLTATAASSSQINLAWNVSTDNVGVTGYKVFRGGTLLGTAAATTYQDTGLSPSTSYSYTVAAFDAVGNTSAQSASASATTLASSGRVIEIFPSNANGTCNEEFENVANTLKPGDTLILHGGTYTQGCRRLLTGLNGTPASPIVIQAAPGENPIVTRPDASENNIEIDNSSYLVIRGLHFQGGDSGFRIMGGHHITFEDNEIYNTDNNALRANDSNVDSLVVRHNEIHHTGLFSSGPTEGEGMYLGCHTGTCRVTNSLIIGNHVHHTRGTSSGGNDGIEVKVGSSNNIIRDNVIHDTNIGMAYPCITVYGGGTTVNTVEGNVLWNCGEAIYAVSDAVLRNNIILNSDLGISSYSHEVVATRKNLTIINNTIYNHGTCLYLRMSGVSGVTVANNAVYCGGSTAVDASGLGGASVSSNYVSGGLSGVSIDNSAFFNGGTAANAFTDPVNMDFWLKSGSTLLGKANASFVPSLDFNGTTRTAPFDVGAYETEGIAANPGWKVTAGFKPITTP